MSLWKAIVGKTEVPDYRSPRIDASSNSFQFVDYPHHETHEGDSYVASYAADISIGNDLLFLVITPTTPEMHAVLDIQCESETDISLFEAPTTSANGTSVAAINKRRTGTPPTAGATVFHTPTVSANGTLLANQHIGSGKGGGAEIQGRDEWILKPGGTKYLIKCTATAAGYISAAIRWYEHTPETGD